MSAARLRDALRYLEALKVSSTAGDWDITLHRTVDVLLDMLRYGLAAAEADAPLSQYKRELALADAILAGGAS